ncbi:MAG: endolytic transglycosylase MltG [bacterium JZ-2024 1]
MKQAGILLLSSFITFFFLSFYPLHPSGYIEIPYGYTAEQVGKELYKKRWLNLLLLWKIFVKIQQKERNIQAGIYEYPAGKNVWELVGYLQKPESRTLREITFPEGITAEEMASLLESYHFTRKGDFLAEVQNPKKYADILPWLSSPEVITLEGYLFPDTYTFSPMMPAESLVRTMLIRFKEILPDNAEVLAEARQLTLHQCIIIASLVERETLWDSEKPLVASVIYNRWKIGMKLQIDATISYALRKWKPLTKQDLLVDHPYNTYLYKGFPPGPIGNPGKISIYSAFSFPKTPYLYFALWENGYHRFSKTYEEHRRWQRESPAIRKWYGQGDESPGESPE